MARPRDHQASAADRVLTRGLPGAFSHGPRIERERVAMTLWPVGGPAVPPGMIAGHDGIGVGTVALVRFALPFDSARAGAAAIVGRLLLPRQETTPCGVRMFALLVSKRVCSQEL